MIKQRAMSHVATENQHTCVADGDEQGSVNDNRLSTDSVLGSGL